MSLFTSPESILPRRHGTPKSALMKPLRSSSGSANAARRPDLNARGDRAERRERWPGTAWATVTVLLGGRASGLGLATVRGRAGPKVNARGRALEVVGSLADSPLRRCEVVESAAARPQPPSARFVDEHLRATALGSAPASSAALMSARRSSRGRDRYLRLRRRAGCEPHADRPHPVL